MPTKVEVDACEWRSGMENGSRKGTAQGRVGFSANKSRGRRVRMEIGNGEWRLEGDRPKGSVRVSGDRKWRMEDGRELPKQDDLSQ